MYKFTRCTYEELKTILEKNYFQLSGWKFIKKEYVEYVEKIESETGELIALIHYYFKDNFKDKSCCLAFFEVLKEYRGKGHGKEIIKQFLNSYSEEVYLTPYDDAIPFGEKCGFEGAATMHYNI